MQFKTAAQQACYEKVAPWMQQLFGNLVVADENEPLFGVNVGSAVAYTKIVPWGDDDAIIVTRSYVVTNVKLTPELMHYLLRTNDSLYFGAFALDDEDDIIFEHSLVGSNCHAEELMNSVLTVVKFANTYDDEIVNRWGGQRALER